MQRLFLLDANSLIHRAFHALPPFVNKSGEATGAIYGLANILLKILKEDAPDFIAAFFDRPEPTFRKEIFEDYKIHRPKAPPELISQIITARELFRCLGIKTFELPGFEADDLIGTAAEKFKNNLDLQIVILTGDLDALQLVLNEKIIAKTFKKGVSETVVYGEKEVAERYGLGPESLRDYKALIGDSSDNIPGVPGIGPKTAVNLLKKYGDLDALLKNGQGEKSYPQLAASEKQILLSKKLAAIVRDAPLEINLEELIYRGYQVRDLTDYFEKMGFQSLIKRIGGELAQNEKSKIRSLF